MTSQRQGPKCSLACQHCRVKKAKCSGTKPCGNCLDHKQECWFPETQPRVRKRKDRDQALDERFARLEALLQASRFSVPPELPTQTILVSTDQESHSTRLEDVSMPVPECESTAALTEAFAMPQTPSERQLSASTVECLHTQGSRLPTMSSCSPPHLSEPNIAMKPAHDQVFPGSIVYNGMARPVDYLGPFPGPHGSGDVPASPPTTINSDGYREAKIGEVTEVQGPQSYLSICSEPAMDWVSHHIGVPDFTSIARRLTMDVMRNEKLERAVQAERATEPDFETAWRWTTAYFDEGLDSVFGIIHRPSFEYRLRAHYETQPPAPNQDNAWYALRNAVCAAGCRITLSDGPYPSAFIEARAQSWRYFENALSVHTELIYARSNVIAIQALAVMAFFAEGLGSPALEYMLLSNAIRLAQAKGFHLQARPSRSLTEEEISLRNSLWWSLYSYDKHLVYRLGRPSAIDDDDISAPVPSVGIPGHHVNIEFYQNTTKHAQISSLISKRLSTVKAAMRSPEDILTIVEDLDKRLRIWHDELPPAFRYGPPFKPLKLGSGIKLAHVIFTRFIYCGSLIAMHSIFCHPWSRSELATSQNPAVVTQRQRSTEIVASASREIIMTTQGLSVSASSPVWLTFYFPLVGLINLFLHVIQHPHLPTANSDISLMDVVVGHFGYMEYASGSGHVVQFPRKIVSYAREVVSRTTEAKIGQGLMQAPSGNVESTLPGLPDSFLDFPLPEFVTSEMSEFGFDDWDGILAV